MEKLKDIFNLREHTYLIQTEAILEVIRPNVLTAIFELLEKEQKDIKWEDIQLVDDVILIVAHVSYLPGDVIVTEEGETLTISDKNISHYKKLIRIGIPVVLAETGSKEEVIIFLQNNKRLPYALQRSQTTDAFDATQLTSEQQAQLDLYLKNDPTGRQKH